MATGRGCGHEVPATGFVLITVPAPMVVDAAVVTGPGVRPAFLIAAPAAACGWPVTCGMPIMTGPGGPLVVTTAPRPALTPNAGPVPLTPPARSGCPLRLV